MTQVGELNDGEVLQCGKRVFDGCWFWMPPREGKGCHVLHTGVYIQRAWQATHKLPLTSLVCPRLMPSLKGGLKNTCSPGAKKNDFGYG
jgi:hypothetical protein